MDVSEKRRLSNEAQMQMKALSRINHWKNISLILSAVGVVIAYYGMTGGVQNLFLGICGILVVVICTLGAVILNLGLKNGRRNVGKIIEILDKEVRS